jgi:5-methylcytosine-specific restriction enzyme subunit McrC
VVEAAIRDGIPVRNLWLLMFYASDLRHLGEQQAGSEHSPDELPDLVAELLCHFVARRLRKNLSRSYVGKEAVLTRVRGRIDHLRTARQRLMERGQIACRFEELTLYTPRNRYVRSALSHLASLVADPELKKTCRMLAGQMLQLGVTGPVPTRAQIMNERFGRHDAEDQPMVTAARLAFDLKIPTEQADSLRLLKPEEDANWLRRLFEKAVAGFYEVTLEPRGWRVLPSRKHAWPIEDATSGIEAILPGMQTDIILENQAQGRRIIIDTKFAEILKANQHQNQRLKSGYLYQLYTYLRSQEGHDALAEHAEGLLLHPSVGYELDEAVTIQGHRIRFATVDLTASTRQIRNTLLQRVDVYTDQGRQTAASGAA